MQSSKSQIQALRFAGGVRFHRKMWKGRSQILDPVTKLMGKDKFEWIKSNKKPLMELNQQ